MATSQERRLAQEIADLEKDTGFKLRVLAQNYPDTPGLLYILSPCDLRVWYIYLYRTFAILFQNLNWSAFPIIDRII